MRHAIPYKKTKSRAKIRFNLYSKGEPVGLGDRFSSIVERIVKKNSKIVKINN